MFPELQILHCYRTFYPESQGGLEQVILEVAQKTDKCGVLTLADTPANLNLNGRLPVVAKKRWFSIASCCIGPGFFGALYRSKAKLLHFHFPWPFGDLAYFVAGKSRPLVVTYHSDIVRQRLLGAIYWPLMRWFLARADRIVATSYNYLESSPVLAAYKDKVKVIPLGVSEDGYPEPSDKTMKSLELQFGRDFMLFVGVLRYYKGLEFLIRAAANQPYRVVIAGKGPEASRLKSRVDKLGASNICFAGFVSDEEKVALMKLCRAVVFPSHLRSEAFGVTLIEGLMNSKPLISCEIGTGTSFVNQDGVTGHVVRPADHLALREAMDDLWSDAVKAEEMGCAGRSRYERLFTADKMAEAYHQLYREVLLERGVVD
ncbi:glycosyltransferase [Microbulbifer variabilis]|uniref:Glycosyltransferase n=1 Tax=Microbulbifer variabilis TaxID=266805 RepID=A0ABY4V6J1_9GAMM|nr:glycosyltransferase [Microbulbifer variabilis]USD19891.1 glycosyltransferase [Microbulbifer variabilis]